MYILRCFLLNLTNAPHVIFIYLINNQINMNNVIKNILIIFLVFINRIQNSFYIITY